MFIKTEKQREACNILNQYEHGLLYGGSRSGKTTIAVRNMVLRAIKRPSRHLICRLHFNHVKQSVGMDTLPKVMKMCFPELKGKWRINRSDWFAEIPTQCGGISEIWLGGVDDKERIEKILGNEYSTIHINEASQVSHEAVTLLRTRLAENSGLKLRMYYDLNPSGKKHWTHQEFLEGFIPGTKESHTLNCGHVVINPFDNLKNLPEAYLGILQSLPKRQRQRFLDGLYLSDVEGALWTDAEVSQAKSKTPGNIRKTVIAVDPSVSNNARSDECGLIAASLDENYEGIVHDDWSIKASTQTWAQRAVNMYHHFNANEIVAEVNQGGDLVVDAIHNIDRNIKVIKVHASKGKFARAEPVQQLYEQGKVSHEREMPKLEEEMTEWVPESSSKSPNRLDGLVWALTRLMLGNKIMTGISPISLGKSSNWR